MSQVCGPLFGTVLQVAVYSFYFDALSAFYWRQRVLYMYIAYAK